MTTISEYFEAVKNFDWFYQMSDDHRVYTKGKNAWSLLTHQSHNSPVHLRILKDWSDYKNGTVDASQAEPPPEPKLEDYINDEET